MSSHGNAGCAHLPLTGRDSAGERAQSGAVTDDAGLWSLVTVGLDALPGRLAQPLHFPDSLELGLLEPVRRLEQTRDRGSIARGDAIAELGRDGSTIGPARNPCLVANSPPPTDTGSTHTATIRPNRSRCTDQFAVQLYINDVGHITALNLLLGTRS
jgi:hypothetical protein